LGVGVALGLATEAPIGVFEAINANGVIVASSIVGMGGMGEGGTGVAVGNAAFVKASWVIIIGTAVFCISMTLKVGWDAAPHAVSIVIRNMETTNRLLLFIFSPSKVFLPQSLALRKSYFQFWN
jgi:hypothetical protein